MAKGKYEYWISEDGSAHLKAMARDGLTDEQIAIKCDVAPSTLYEWKKRFPEISEALKKGKEIVDIEVENALLKRAKGYEYEEVKVETEAGIEVKRTVITKHVPPDVGAAMAWLKNRKPDTWKDKQVTEGKVDTEVTVHLEGGVNDYAV